MIDKDEYDSFDGYVDALEARIAELESRLAQREADCIHNIEEHARLGSRLGERITELEAENARLRDGISLHRADTKMRAGSLWGASQEDATLWALLGGGENGHR